MVKQAVQYKTTVLDKKKNKKNIGTQQTGHADTPL